MVRSGVPSGCLGEVCGTTRRIAEAVVWYVGDRTRQLERGSYAELDQSAFVAESRPRSSGRRRWLLRGGEGGRRLRAEVLRRRGEVHAVLAPVLLAVLVSDSSTGRCQGTLSWPRQVSGEALCEC